MRAIEHAGWLAARARVRSMHSVATTQQHGSMQRRPTHLAARVADDDAGRGSRRGQRRDTLNHQPCGRGAVADRRRRLRAQVQAVREWTAVCADSASSTRGEPNACAQRRTVVALGAPAAPPAASWPRNAEEVSICARAPWGPEDASASSSSSSSDGAAAAGSSSVRRPRRWWWHGAAAIGVGGS